MAKFLGPSGVVLPSNPSSDLQAATKQYVDTTLLPGQVVCSVKKTTAQSIASSSSVAVAVTWGTTVINKSSVWTSGSSLVIPQTGIYSVTYSLGWASQAGGIRYSYAQLAGTNIDGTGMIIRGVPSGNLITSAPAVAFSATSGQSVVLYALQDSGSAVNLINSPSTYISTMILRYEGA